MSEEQGEDVYYLWRTALTPAGGSAVLAGHPAELEGGGFPMDVGRRLPRAPAVPLRMRREENEPGPLTDCLRTYGKWALIVSDLLRSVLDQQGVTNIEWYPLVVEDVLEGGEHSYWCGNVIGVVDCVDPERSVLDEFDLFRRLWIDPDAAQGLPIFRLKDHEELHVLVHRRVHEAIEAAGCTGLAFVPANGWCDLEAEPLAEGEEEGEDEPYVPWC